MVEFDERFCAVLCCGHRVGVTRHPLRIARSTCGAHFRSALSEHDRTLPHTRRAVRCSTDASDIRASTQAVLSDASSQRPALPDSAESSTVRGTRHEHAEGSSRRVARKVGHETANADRRTKAAQQKLDRLDEAFIYGRAATRRHAARCRCATARRRGSSWAAGIQTDGARRAHLAGRGPMTKSGWKLPEPWTRRARPPLLGKPQNGFVRPAKAGAFSGR